MPERAAEFAEPVQCGDLSSRISKPSPQSLGRCDAVARQHPVQARKLHRRWPRRASREYERRPQQLGGERHQVGDRRCDPVPRGRGATLQRRRPHAERLEDRLGRGSRPNSIPLRLHRRGQHAEPVVGVDPALPGAASTSADASTDPEAWASRCRTVEPADPRGVSRSTTPSSTATCAARATSGLVTDAKRNGARCRRGAQEHRSVRPPPRRRSGPASRRGRRVQTCGRSLVRASRPSRSPPRGGHRCRSTRRAR